MCLRTTRKSVHSEVRAQVAARCDNLQKSLSERDNESEGRRYRRGRIGERGEQTGSRGSPMI